MTTIEAGAPLKALAWRSWTIALCFGAPVLVLVLSYGWLALDHHTLALWSVTVHESGRHTLAGTVFYFSHFLRELPVILGMALFMLAAVERAQPDGRFKNPPGQGLGAGWALAGALAVMVLAFTITARQGGLDWALSNLLQFRTRDDVSAYGTHWRYHVLSTLWFALAAPLWARLAVGRLDVEGAMGVSLLSWLAWGYFAGMTLIFGVSADIVLSVLYAGHQAREIVTHAVVTAPLLAGVLWLTLGERPTSPRSVVWAPDREAWLRIAALAVILIWLAGVLLTGDPLSEGQADNGLAAMVAGHFFEHLLDYVLVILLALSAGLLRPLMRRPGDAS